MQQIMYECFFSDSNSGKTGKPVTKPVTAADLEAQWRKEEEEKQRKEKEKEDEKKKEELKKEQEEERKRQQEEAERLVNLTFVYSKDIRCSVHR